MRQLFSVFLFSFASLFFSQCEIREISFSLEDVLMFFKIEEQNKKTKIQGIDNFEIKADKRPENEIQEIDKFELEAAKKPANIIQNVYEMNVLKVPRPENVPQNTNAVTILGLEKPENVVESIDEIVINADEKPGNEFQGIDKIELEAAKRPENEIETVDQMTVLKKPRQENVVQSTNEVTILGLEKPENIVESIDEIVINADEKPGNEFQHIDKIVIKAKEKEQNIIQNIQEISIPAKQRHANEFQHIDEIELKAKEKEQNIIQKTQEIIIPAKQRHENEIQQIESIELLEIERPQIKPELIDEIYLHDVVKPENKIEEKDNFLIEGKKKEDLQIVIGNNLLFSKKEQQKKTNELCKAEKFQILCAEKKKQNIIEKKEEFQIISEGSGKLEEISQILEENKEMADEYKNLEENVEYIKGFLNYIKGDEQNGENQNIIEKKEEFQIQGKESAEVIKLRQNADVMRKALQEYEGNHKKVLEVLKNDGMDEILKTSENKDAAIPKIMEILKKRREKEMLEAGKDINKKNILDTKKIEEFRKGNDDFKRELEEKFSGFTEDFKKFGEELSKFDIEHKKVIDENKVLRDELTKKENVDETPRNKHVFKKYKESEIFSDNNTKNKLLRFNSRGYSRDRNSIYDQELKEERMSMLSSISKKLNFRTSSYSPRKNNRNSFPPFFDGKKFYTDQRQQKIIISENIYDIPQDEGSFDVLDVNVLNKKERNVSIDLEVCHETSLQIQNGNEAMKLNNVKEVRNKNKKKIVKTINIKKKRGRVGIDRKKRTTVGYRGNVIKKLCLKKFKISKLNVVGKKLGPRTSFNTINNKSNTSFLNSGMYGDKMEDKNIINNTFVQNKKKKSLGMLEENVKKDIKRFSYVRGVKENVKKQIYIEKDLLKEKKDTTKFILLQKKNDEVMKKNYAKISVFQQQEKTSGAHIENQKIQQKEINIPSEIDVKANCGVLTKKVLNNVNKMPRTSINLTKNMVKSVITKQSENSNNNSNSFVSLERNENSIDVNELRLNKKIKGGKKKNNLHEDKKDTKKNSFLKK